ncbi:MAG: hypothetical protein DHS20C11_18400 [Lysobacteraceae bacterium]|nr:MAG: hypothetical protein DHS20C11_18400 [Xanthomonadaceae bacterium]
MTKAGKRVGNFRIVRSLGRGGMGEVYEGFDETLQRRVALKTIRAEKRINDTVRTRFQREARMLSQLDHPGICRIYDYVKGEQCDYLVLELIDGRTLRDALNDKLAFKEKLRIASAVAEALVAAHRIGIVHRDLKPRNVMLTTEGGVKVLDFGLARSALSSAVDDSTIQGTAASDTTLDLEADDNAQAEATSELNDGNGWGAPMATSIHDISTPDLRLQQRANEPVDEGDGSTLKSGPESSTLDNPTRVGARVGTPIYMSPEQARGEFVTTASDMYSLGLLLQVLFTEKDPYQDGLSTKQILERATRGESQAPVGTDRQITVLINQLKVLAPSDRPTALSVVNRLARIATRSRRMLQLAAVAVIVALLAAGGVKYTLDLRAERSIATHAREDADRRREQAEELIGFMLGDLRSKLQPLGRLDVLDDAGKQALGYFDSLEPNEISAEDLYRNSVALYQLGEVWMIQGRLDQAMPVLSRSLELAEQAVERQPGNDEWLLGVGTSHFWIGDAWRRQGDFEQALSHFTKYMEIATDLADRHPGNTEYELERAYGHTNVGVVLESRGQLERALGHFKISLQIRQARLQRDPSSATLRSAYANGLNKIGVLLQKLGAFQQALETLALERETYQALTAEDPNHTRWKHRLAVNHAYASDVYESLGEIAQALEHANVEHDRWVRLTQHDPSNTQWHRNLAMSFERLGNLERINGDHEKALRLVQTGATLIGQLLANDPDQIPWRRDDAAIQVGLGQIRFAMGDSLGSLAVTAAAASTLRELLQSDPSDSKTNRLLARAELLLGDLARSSDDQTAANDAYQRALANTPQDTEELRVVDLRARALLKLGLEQQATPLLRRLKQSNYHHPDFETIRKQVEFPVTTAEAPTAQGQN